MRKIFPIAMLVILLLLSVSVYADNITTITDLYDFSDVGEGKITEDIILPNNLYVHASGGSVAVNPSVKRFEGRTYANRAVLSPCKNVENPDCGVSIIPETDSMLFVDMYNVAAEGSEPRNFEVKQDGKVLGSFTLDGKTMITTEPMQVKKGIPVYIYVTGKYGLIFYGAGLKYESESPDAVPGIQGGGKKTTGARGSKNISVYHVTSLENDGPGTLRDAVSRPGRIVVFDVCGTINLTERLKIGNSNITILGQTAPGQGITIAGTDVLIAADNVIIRYLRVRPGDSVEGEWDCLGGAYINNIVLDHCSVSWGIDELMSLYGGVNSNGVDTGNYTISNCLISESLRLSNHYKGAHGYGAIWGGTNTSYYNNIIAHHDSRNPRLASNVKNTELKNNVIYNWGGNSSYGGESTDENTYTKANMVNSYYKFGPSTKSKYKIFDVSGTGSHYYINGNYVYGYESENNNNALSDNWADEALVHNMANAVRENEPFDMGEYKVDEDSAEEAYDRAVKSAGAVLPVRDSIDARVVEDIKNQTGRLINKAFEVGGYVDMSGDSKIFKISESWKEANNMGDAAETDIIREGLYKGYTWLEAYVFDEVEKLSYTEQGWTNSIEPTNPKITVTKVSDGTQTVTGYANIYNNTPYISTDKRSIEYGAVSEPIQGTQITKIEIYDGERLIETAEGTAAINTTINLPPGTHYITSRAYNDKGESTSSDTSIIYICGLSDGEWLYTDIGSVPYKGGYIENENGFSIIASGSVGGNSAGKLDSCGFMYREFTGDFDIILETKNVPKIENNVKSGIMVRSSLDSNSEMYLLADSWLKFGENIRVFERPVKGTAVTNSYMYGADGAPIENVDSITYDMPKYLRMTRKGQRLTMSVSESGKDFTDNIRQPYIIDDTTLPETVYLGVAQDSCSSSTLIKYAAEFEFDVTISKAEKNNQVKIYDEDGNEIKNNTVIENDAVISKIVIPDDITPNGSVIYTAVYKDECLTNMQTGSDVNVSVSAGDLVKVFIWDDNMQPLYTEE